MKTVLIIDDEKELTGHLATFLERKGFKVFTALTGEEGLELHKENRPDCVLLDLHLPQMDGMTVLKKIKEADPEANVYLFTGDSSPDLRQQGESLGAKGCLLKPVNIKEVVKILEGL